MSELLIVRGSRGKAALLVLGCIVFVAMGIWAISSPMDQSSRYSPEYVHFMSWCAVLLFSTFGFLGAASLVKPAAVILSQTGFQVTELRARPLVHWDDVDRFFIMKVRGAKILAYSLKPAMTSALEQLAASRRPAWGDGSIPANLKNGPDEMLALLEDWRLRHAS